MKERIALGAVVVLAVVGTAALVGGVLVAANRQDQLCQVLRGTIEASGASIGRKGAPGYDYYRTHPDEAAVARRQNRELVRKLDFCSAPPPPEVKARLAPRERQTPRRRTRARRSEAVRTPQVASVSPQTRRIPASTPDRAADRRPPATTNPPQHGPQPVQEPVQQAPPSQPPPEPPRDPTVFERVCTHLPDVARQRVC